MDQVIRQLTTWWLYDMHVFSQGWLYYWLLVPFIFYFSFFVSKWMIITLPVWLPINIIIDCFKKNSGHTESGHIEDDRVFDDEPNVPDPREIRRCRENKHR